jgi:pimeloyl-ACP methyl ester carboxylesterase
VSADVRHRLVRSNGISLHVAEAGEGNPVVLCHGFPELWSTWRHQIDGLAAAGYRVIAPDMRGYGGSDAPAAVEAYAMKELVADVVGLIDGIGAERAVVVGHDWGASVAWQTALDAPERVAAVASLSVPYIPFPMKPTELFEAFFPGAFMYMLYFQAPGVADAELGRDARETLLRMAWSTSGAQPAVPEGPLPRVGTGYLDTLAPAPDTVPAWLAEVLDEHAATFARTGFTGGLNWYRNLDRNWEASSASEAHVTPPALFIAGEHDGILRLLNPAEMSKWVDDLHGVVMLPGVGHWTGEEDPAGVNSALLAFLREAGW